MKEITTMTTKELVAEYNQLTDSKIKKFSSRKAGERQLAAARSGAKGKKPATPAEPAATPAKTPKPKRDPKARSNAIRESWASKDVAAARSARTNVKCNGEEYRSVAEAFKALNLPMGKHIKFRAEVKAAGRGVFDHNDKKFTFTTVKSKEE